MANLVRPGGPVDARPLSFLWLCDASASMGVDGKMDALNRGIREALPEMLRVAGANPHARVLVNALVFSKSARWIAPEPRELTSFSWSDLRADELAAGSAAHSGEFRRRLEREGAQTGDVQISLIWNNYNDLDLHVICPSGEEIAFNHRRSLCGGELDVDMNVSPTSEEPVENVYWPAGGAPKGHYQVFVEHYRNHGLSGCDDPTPFTVRVKVGATERQFTARISHDAEPALVHEFDLDPAAIAAPGGGNTSLGAALKSVAARLRMPPMPPRGLPPVLVLLSDGQPTDDFEAGLRDLMAQPWGQKAVRIAIAIGRDADLDVLRKFIGTSAIPPLQADNPAALVAYIRWASTAVLQAASSPASQSSADDGPGNVPIPPPPEQLTSNRQVW